MAGISSTCGIVQAVRSKLHGRKSLTRRHRPQRCGPLFEVLEPRLLLSASATFATSALADYGPKPPALMVPLMAGTHQSDISQSSNSVAAVGSGSYPTLVNPTATAQASSLSLTAGAQVYLYGGESGGYSGITPFTNGSGTTVNDAAGNLATELVSTNQPTNSFTDPGP